MQQKRLTLLKQALLAVLMLNILISCKKTSTSTTPPPYIPTPPPGFVYIPASTDKDSIGSLATDPDSQPKERPRHKIIISAFYMQKTEVTIGALIDFLGSSDTNYLAPDQRKFTDFQGGFTGETFSFPAVNISWYSAVRYTNWLSKKEQLDTCYQFYANSSGNDSIVCDVSKKGYRLPTEAEWEYACRAGSNKAYCFGDANLDSLKAYAWYADNSGNITHIGSGKKPNAWGLYDMHGNVWEWCSDVYDENYYSAMGATKPNPTGPAPINNSYRVIRGGSWNNFAVHLRSAVRFDYTPVNRGNDVGFRLAKTM